MDHKLQLVQPNKYSENHIASLLTQDEYKICARHMYECNLGKIDDLQSSTDETRTMSLFQLAQKAPPRRRPEFVEAHELPEWFQIILSKISDEKINENHVDRTWRIKQNLLVDKDEQTNQTQQQIDTNMLYEAWTDGSAYLETKKMGSATVIVPTTQTNNNTSQTVKQVIKTIPPPSDLFSSTRPELWAIYTTIQTLKHQSNLTIYTDSQSSINAINTGLKSANVRDILKRQNNIILHQIIDLVRSNNINLNLVKVKAHDNIPLNDEADRQAKEACNANNTDIGRRQVSSPYLFYKHQNRCKYIEQYPSQYINHRFQTDVAQQLDEYLQKSHLDIDTDLTLTSINKGLGKTNRLDATPTNEISFRLKNITNKLPTLERLQLTYKKELDNTCPRCQHAVETQIHIWQCPDTTAKLEILRDTFTQYLQEGPNNSTDWKHLTKLNNKPTWTDLYNLLPIEDPDVYNSPPSFGIITTSFRQTSEQKLGNFPMKTQWILFTIDSWLRTIYNKVWKPRTKFITSRRITEELHRAFLIKRQQRPIIRIPVALLRTTIHIPRTIWNTAITHRRHRSPSPVRPISNTKRLKFNSSHTNDNQEQTMCTHKDADSLHATNSDNPNTPPFANTIQAPLPFLDETAPTNTKYKLNCPRHIRIRKHNQFTQSDITSTNPSRPHIKIPKNIWFNEYNKRPQNDNIPTVSKRPRITETQKQHTTEDTNDPNDIYIQSQTNQAM
jgi:ribonuclease HI